MKKLFVISPQFSGGGAEHVCRNIVLSELNTHFETYGFSYQRKNSEEFISRCNSANVILIEKENLSSKIFFFILAWHILVKRPDVVFSSQIQVNLLLCLLKTIKIFRGRLVIREANSPKHLLRDPYFFLWGKIIYSFLYSKADCIISLSELMRLEILNLTQLPSKKIELVRNPVDVESIRSILPGKFMKNNATVEFLCVGSLLPKKGFDRLILDLASFEDDFKLYIYGQGKWKAYLLNLIKLHGLSDKVFLRGYSENWHEHLLNSCGLIIPSRWEGMPNVALEALALGLPVIGSKDAGALSELAELASNGSVLIYDDRDELHSRLKFVIKNSSGTNINELPDCFRKERVIRQLIEIFDQ